jgi:uncharacterized membrane protein
MPISANSRSLEPAACRGIYSRYGNWLPLMDDARTARLRERLFRVSVWLKGVDAGLEIVGGVALLVVSPGFILSVAALLTQDELTEDPRDFIANHLLDAAKHFSLTDEHFMVFYLLSHGVSKLFLVIALLREKLWAYPIALAVFGAFILYQLYRFTFTNSIGLIALSLFDLVMVELIWLEYRALQRRPERFAATQR